MRQRQNLALGILLGSLGIIFGLSAPAQTTRARKDMTIPERIADATRLSEQDVNKFLTAIGPAIRDDLRQGKEVSLPGLGTFRVVRVAEHKDLVNGRPAVIPATNTVEFIPELMLHWRPEFRGSVREALRLYQAKYSGSGFDYL